MKNPVYLFEIIGGSHCWKSWERD